MCTFGRIFSCDPLNFRDDYQIWPIEDMPEKILLKHLIWMNFVICLRGYGQPYHSVWIPWIIGSLRKEITLNTSSKKTSADYGSTCFSLLTSFVRTPAAVKLYSIYSRHSWRIITWGVHVASCNMNRALTNPLQGATTRPASLSGISALLQCEREGEHRLTWNVTLIGTRTSRCTLGFP